MDTLAKRCSRVVSEPDPSQLRRKGLGTCPHSSCPYGMQLNLCMVNSDLWWHHAHVRCRSARCLPPTFVKYSGKILNSTVICRIRYLVVGGTESLKKNHFHDIICNQRFWLVRSTFRPGDNSDAREWPDPSSYCEGSGSKTSSRDGHFYVISNITVNGYNKWGLPTA